jgi:hypothetical protein
MIEKMDDHSKEYTLLCNKEHGGRGFRVDECSVPKELLVKRSLEDDWTQFAFNLLYKRDLRVGATYITDFRMGATAVYQRNILAVFTELVEEMSCVGIKIPKSSNCLYFLETLVSKTNEPQVPVDAGGGSNQAETEHQAEETEVERPIGLRIHFFCNRSKSNPDDEFMAKFFTRLESEFKSVQRRMDRSRDKTAMYPWERHLACHDRLTWLEYVCMYEGSVERRRSYDQLSDEGKTISPKVVFTIERACELTQRYEPDCCEEQANVSKYIFDYDNVSDGFHFPREDLVLRVDLKHINIQSLFEFRRYLPSYYFEYISLPLMKTWNLPYKLPAAQGGGDANIVFVPNTRDFGGLLSAKYSETSETFKNCLRRSTEEFKKSMDYEFPQKEEFKNKLKSCWCMKKPSFDKMCNELKNVVSVCDMNTVPFTPVFATEGLRSWYSATHKFSILYMTSQYYSSVMLPSENNADEKSILQNKRTLDRLDMLRLKAILRRNTYRTRSEFQEATMEEFKTRIILDDEANVSEPLANIVRWWKTTRKKSVVPRLKMDDDGSLFLNDIAWTLNFFDKDLQVATGHPTLLILNVSKYDSYRQEHNLHMNMIFTGEGATSKSFLFDQMKLMSIPGTMLELTYQTLRANAIETDKNDECIIFNEAPPGMFITHKAVDPNAEAMFKELLTSMKVSCSVFHKDELTGERKNRRILSNKICTHFGATNDDPSDCNEAMRTRFYFGEFEKTERKNKSLDQCMRGAKDWEQYGKEFLDEAYHTFHLEHAAITFLFKLMYLTVLEYPTMFAADTVYSQMQKSLRASKITTTTRFKERFDILCQIHTMRNAFNAVFTYAGGECCWLVEPCMYCRDVEYHGKECCRRSFACTHPDCHGKPSCCNRGDGSKCEPYVFKEEDLLKVQPYLFCTEEIAIFCFTSLSNEVYNPSEYKILKAIWKLWVLSGCKYNKVTRADDETSGEGMYDQSQKVNDYDYIRFEKAGHKLRVAIQQAIPFHEGRPSEYNIKQMFERLGTSTQESVPFELRLAVTAQDPNDNLPKRKRDTIATMKYDVFKTDGVGSSFHMSLFDQVRHKNYDDPVLKAVKACQHHYSEEKKVILGTPERKEGIIVHASVMQCMDIEPKCGNIIMQMNSLHKCETDMIIRNRTTLIDQEREIATRLVADLDDVAAAAHARRLGIIETTKISEFIETYGMLARVNQFRCHKNPIVYPDDVLYELNAPPKQSENARAAHTEGIAIQSGSRRKVKRSRKQREYDEQVSTSRKKKRRSNQDVDFFEELEIRQ